MGHSGLGKRTRTLLQASATPLLVEVRGSGRSPREFCEQARACGQCSATLPMFESFGVLSRQNNRYPLALVGLRSKTSLDTYLARSLYRLGSTGKMPAGLTGKMAVLREKRLFPTHFSSSFRAGHGKSQTRLSHALSFPALLRKR